jgi:hypothetical protein
MGMNVECAAGAAAVGVKVRCAAGAAAVVNVSPAATSGTMNTVRRVR